MRTAIVGYPRIGKNRELKFALEKYFRGEIDASALSDISSSLRRSQWETLSSSGLDFIPSGDFSYYDGMLDTACMLGAVPARYRALGLSPLDTYFAMARGYQGEAGDETALPMKKWFNTNYHYIVPEIDDDTVISLSSSGPIDHFLEARALGIETMPSMIGPYSFLKAARFVGSARESDFAEPVSAAYASLLSRLDSLSASWVQLYEPYLVMDMDESDLALLRDIYSALLPSRGSVRVLLTTFFGDVRDSYTTLTALPIDGLGLDFVEGRLTGELIESCGFPSDKTLFAGLINGKNIWRNDYAATLAALSALEAQGIDTVLTTSCSLLHVPYSLEGETGIPASYLEHFAFAQEKLEELAEIKALAGEKAPVTLASTKERPDTLDPAVRERVASITREDCRRKPDFYEREMIQRERFSLPLYPTTTIGSFPQTADVRAKRRAYRKGEIDEIEYREFCRARIAEWIDLQEEIGLDVLVHGEFERGDMVEYFGEQLKGFLFTEQAWVQSYGTRCVKPPIIWGDVSRPSPMTLEWSVFAQSLTGRPVKGMLTGAVTILNWSFPREDISVRESALQIALALRDEVMDLEAAGISIIQIDEPALREKLPLRRSDWYSEYLDWAVPAFRLISSGVGAATQIHTHMCYSEFGDIVGAIDDMDADVISFEASRSDLVLLDFLREAHFRTEVGPGVYDIHSPRVPSTEEIAGALRLMRDRVDRRKLWVNPDCGLKTRAREEVIPALTHMVEAARILREEG